MRTEKWNLYIEKHASVAYTDHTVEGIKNITQFLPLDIYPKMLDVGVACGLETDCLRQVGYDVIGIINGELNVRYAKENYPDTKYVEADMHDLPFPSESFNCIYTNHVFEHALSPFILLLEFYCILKPNGRVWIALPDFCELEEDINGNIINGTVSHHHPNGLCYNIFKQLFTSAGFKIIYNNKSDKMPYIDTPYLIEKQPLNFLHSTVQEIVLERKKLFG